MSIAQLPTQGKWQESTLNDLFLGEMETKLNLFKTVVNANFEAIFSHSDLSIKY